ncbi:Holliday junction branch migration DNA helicase RuvB [bacterium]|nr:MAG: Holliday junction branch migration DNA helicase RuvB [bacterium]
MDDFSIASQQQVEDTELDVTLRPQSLGEFVGQDQIKENLSVFIEAAQKRKEPIDHILLHGPAGLGKTSLAHIIAKEMGANIRVTSGPAIERAGDLGSILTNMEEGSILFIDEIHRMNKIVEEVLYPAMEDYCLDLIVGKGPGARTLRLDLPKFTLIGATTRVGLLSSPMRSRFGIIHNLEFYTDKNIEDIVQRSSKILNISSDENGIKRLAQSARFTPRVANRILKRVRDFAEVRADGIITENVAEESLKMLCIDKLGLDPADRKILKCIIEKFDGGPVGSQTLAAATAEEIDTLEDIYEPFLMQIGFLQRTPRGRIVTKAGYEHLGIPYTGNELF